jgi:outer membrane protein assembly factor BamB
VKKHPELAGDQQLGEALQEISQAEQSAIKFVADPIESQTTEAPSAVVATLVLANQFATGSAPIEGPHVFIFGSAAYAVDAANGQLLWRRHLGPQVNLADPVMVGSDVLLFSTIGNELLKLNATSGKLQWRLPLGEVVSQAVVAGNRVFLASESAKLHVVDLASGRREGFVQFAQPLRAAPAVDASGGKLYLSGDHSSLYTLSANDLSCTGVYFSGHAAGTIVVPPALVLNKLAVVENDGAETCRLRLFSVNRDGVIDKELAASRLDGLVLQPLSTTGRRFVVNTDRGTLAVFDVNPGAEGQALTQLAKQTERGSQSYLRYAAMDDRDIWYASRELSKLVVAPTGNRMVVQEVKDDYQGSLFLGPIAVRNGVLLHTRQRGDNPAVTVTATLARDGSTLWQTDLASPPAGGIIASNDPPLLLLAGADGNTFAFDRAAIQARVQNQALPRLSVEFPPLTHGLALPGGRAAFTAAKASKALLFDTNQSPPLQAVELPAPLACEPIALGSGWIAPLAVGQVVYLDSATGKEMAGAFQPPLPPGTEKQWLVPTALDGEAPRFVISDGIEKIYLVELDANKSFLAAVQEAEVGTTPLSTRLASIGNRVFAGSRDGRLVSFTLPGLELDTRVELASTVVWGPYRVGNIVVVATQAGELFAVGDDGQKLWQVQSPASDFAGAPLADGTSVVIPFASGKLVAMAADSGQKVGVSATGQSFVGGAEKLQNMFVVATQDGSILVVSPPNGN